MVRGLRSSHWFSVFFFLLLQVGSNVAAQEFDLKGTTLGSSGEGKGLSFVLQPGNRAAVSFFHESTNSLRYSEAIGASISTTIVDSTLSLPSDTALSFVHGVPHIIYYDQAQNKLLHAYRTHGVWSKEIIDSSGNAGGAPAVIPCGIYLCISYYDAANKDLRFVKGRTGEWSPVTVEASSADIGSSSSITLNPSGNVVIAYYDATNKKPKLALQNSSGQWSIESLPSPNSPGAQFGLWPSVAISSDGTIHVVASESKLSDTTTNDGELWYASKSPSGVWTVEDIEWPYVGGYPSIVIGQSGKPIFAYRYLRHSGLKRGAVFVRERHGAESWSWQELNAPGSGFYKYLRNNLQLNQWGEPVIVSAFERDADQSGGASRGFQIFGPQDLDGDGISDSREVATSKTDADSDDDGVLDGEEVLVSGTNPLARDSDGDGVFDAVDIDPLRNDSGNRIVDGSFDRLVTDPWMPIGRPSIFEKSTAQTVQGTRSMRVVSAGGDSGIEQRELSRSQNANNSLALRYRRISGNVTIQLKWGATTLVTFTDSTSSAWQSFTRQVSSPATANDLRLIVTTSGEMYLDDASLFVNGGSGNSSSATSSSSFSNSSGASSSSSGSNSSSSNSSSTSNSSSSSSQGSSSSAPSNPSPDPGVDTDNDGINDNIDPDDDNDGLTDIEEAGMRTDPKKVDTDKDAVADGQEVTDKTNPLDRGSVLAVLGTTICSEWNTVLSETFNVLEHVNIGESTLRVTVSLYDMQGVVRNRKQFQIAPGQEQDVLVHEMSKSVGKTFGKVCSNHNGMKGDLDGRMVYYKTAPTNQLNYQFALALPFSNGKKGVQFVPFNTFQPSADPADARNFVANWIQITNLSNKTSRGVLTFYDQNGRTLGVKSVNLGKGARKDYAAHLWGAQKVGVVKWAPADSTISHQVRNMRYLYDNPHAANSFETAFQVEGLVGNGQEQSVLLAPDQQTTAVLELINTKNTEVRASVKFYTESGVRKKSFEFTLKPYATRHIIADSILRSERGFVTIHGAQVSSVIAVGMHYVKNAAGGVTSMYGTHAVESLGSVLRGSYNTFLGQKVKMWIINPTNQPQLATLSMVRANGFRIRGGDSQIQLGSQFSVPARGVRVVNLNQYEQQNNYGVVTLQPEKDNSLISWVLRERTGDYIIPTPVRQ